MTTVEGNATGVTVAAQLEPATKPTLNPMSPAPVLISEEAVLFSTAAAVPVGPTTRRWWPAATRSLLAAMHHMSLTSWADNRAPREDCVRGYDGSVTLAG